MAFRLNIYPSIKREHPDWTEEQIQEEIERRHELSGQVDPYLNDGCFEPGMEP